MKGNYMNPFGAPIQTNNVQKDFDLVQVFRTEPRYMTIDLEYDIQREMNFKLTEEITKSGYIKYQKDFDHMRQEYVYKAGLYVGSGRYKSAFVPGDGTFVDGQIFDSQEIEEAIKNTFPERFI